MTPEEMLGRIKWFGNASFLIDASKAIYIDPYKIPDGAKDADIILITHDHFDHCSPADVKKIHSFKTVMIGPGSCRQKFFGQYKLIKPMDTLDVKGVKIRGVFAYNVNKSFHQRSENNLGYLITVDGVTIYHAGDTDMIPEMKNLKPDIAMLPVGGEYTMTASEAIEAVREIKTEIAIPMHYGSVAGNEYDAKHFEDNAPCEVKVFK
ncbi:MAG: MBL fold metallo-hydrolase [Chloroflexi bacterium]|nr:MBL fold metallo-hydrolase [Chloroflexota bacterium]